MKLNLIKTLWGVPGATDPAQWDAILGKIAQQGWDGIEAALVMVQDRPEHWKKLLVKHNLKFIAQIHTCTYAAHPAHTSNGVNNRSYVPSHDLQEHVQSFRSLVFSAKACGAIFVNSHSGSDVWNLATAESFFRQALVLEKEAGIDVAHETHRRRLLWNPFQTRELLKRLPADLKITADLSHWVVVCERVFDQHTDPDWESTLRELSQHIHHIHGRVGFGEGPQVSDPRAPEWRHEVSRHQSWWLLLLKAMHRRGCKECFFEPEHGPSPYQPLVPFTQQPVANIWFVNHHIAERMARLFEAEFGGPKHRLQPLSDPGLQALSSPASTIPKSPYFPSAAAASASRPFSTKLQFSLGSGLLLLAVSSAASVAVGYWLAGAQHKKKP